jgi:hypothetical protein
MMQGESYPNTGKRARARANAQQTYEREEIHRIIKEFDLDTLRSVIAALERSLGRHPTNLDIINWFKENKPEKIQPGLENTIDFDHFDMQKIIGYLHDNLGRIPTENECMRFHMFLGTFPAGVSPSNRECQKFVNLLKGYVVPNV